MKGATARQADVLRLIGDQVEARGFPPTIREMCRALGLRSTNAISTHLRALTAKGLLERAPGRISRGLTITDAGKTLLRGLALLRANAKRVA